MNPLNSIPLWFPRNFHQYSASEKCWIMNIVNKMDLFISSLSNFQKDASAFMLRIFYKNIGTTLKTEPYLSFLVFSQNVKTVDPYLLKFICNIILHIILIIINTIYIIIIYCILINNEMLSLRVTIFNNSFLFNFHWYL